MLLRVSLSTILLAGWVGSALGLGSSALDQLPTLTITGSVAYQSDPALPPGSRVVIELRHLPALPHAAAVVDQQIDLEGRQSPVAFELTVERFKLVRGATYVVRGTIVSENRAIWTADDIKIDVGPSIVDVKEILLRPAKSGASGAVEIPRW